VRDPATGGAPTSRQSPRRHEKRKGARPGLGAIGCPTLVLAGDSDQLTPPELSAEIAEAIPGHV
jgi:pimeloyl-ACP methyl ester carboxylesterase